jgi:hypothetical protein
VEKLQSQQTYLINLRNQASISAAITGLVATFFGTLLSDNRYLIFGDGPFGLSLFALFGFLLFGASIAFSVLVVTDTHRFYFFFDTNIMLQRLNVERSTEEFFKNYISDGEWYCENNEKLIARARSQLWFSLVFGFSQIVPWICLISSEVPD